MRAECQPMKTSDHAPSPFYTLAHSPGSGPERTWRGAVLEVEGDRAYIDAGTRSGLAVGMILDVLAQDKEILDPETGLAVGSVTGKIGRLRVIDVQEHFSSASAVEGCEKLKPGDLVELRP